jgi:ABC-2 type transport system permease protein
LHAPPRLKTPGAFATLGVFHRMDSAAPKLPTRTFFRLLLWVHWRMLLARIRGVRDQSPLLLFVLSGFVVAYLGVGFWLFHSGLEYLYRFPLVGTLLSQRILFLIFGFFFLMLGFSNLVIGYSTLFKSRETEWFLTLPIAHRDVYRWKFVEALVVSSWALIFLSAPLMAAYGQVHGVAPPFYVGVLVAFLPFVVLPALLGSWVIMLIVRILARPWAKRVGLIAVGVAIAAMLFGMRPVTDTEAVSPEAVLSFDQLLRHTRLSVNPYLPSAWLAQSVLSWGQGLVREGTFFFLVLLSTALMGLLLGLGWLDRFFYQSWSVSLSTRAERYQRKALAKQRRGKKASMAVVITDALPFLSRPVRALVLKDARIFWRDPAQWTQFMIFFGLLCIYVLNLRNVAFNFQSEFWETMISYLNLTASALTLSTLTTRFVFPQFSLEGRRLWIVGLAPVGLRRILMQKFWMSSLSAMTITVSLMVASSVMLRLPPQKVVFFAAAIALMSMTLSGLAAGLGALFPNFKEDNPSKIVSGFGGTLCLVVSFIYITVFVALIALPRIRRVMDMPELVPDAVVIASAIAMSLGVLLVPLLTAARRVKNLEF